MQEGKTPGIKETDPAAKAVGRVKEDWGAAGIVRKGKMLRLTAGRNSGRRADGGNAPRGRRGEMPSVPGRRKPSGMFTKRKGKKKRRQAEISGGLSLFNLSGFNSPQLARGNSSR